MVVALLWFRFRVQRLGFRYLSSRRAMSSPPHMTKKRLAKPMYGFMPRSRMRLCGRGWREGYGEGGERERGKGREEERDGGGEREGGRVGGGWLSQIVARKMMGAPC